MTAAELNAKFGIAGVVDFADDGGLIKAVVSIDGTTGELFLQGAQVTAWVPAGARPVIFTSPNAIFAPGTAIRGGIPIIFPWFGAHRSDPEAPQHGFARAVPWQLDAVGTDRPGDVTLSLSFAGGATPSPFWPYRFRAACKVTFGRSLSLSLTVQNRAGEAIGFEEALHSYFTVSDIERISVSGLSGTTYIDKVDGMRRKTEAAEAVSLTSETDRVYLGTPAECSISDPDWQRRIRIQKTGAASTIIWNPWREKAAALRDLGDPAWRSFVCVETGNAADNEIRLAPDSEHVMTTLITVEEIA